MVILAGVERHLRRAVVGPVGHWCLLGRIFGSPMLTHPPTSLVNDPARTRDGDGFVPAFGLRRGGNRGGGYPRHEGRVLGFLFYHRLLVEDPEGAPERRRGQRRFVGHTVPFSLRLAAARR